jgi:hypothetical protein
MEAAFHLAFFVAELVGRDEAGEMADEQRELLRFMTPVMKLTTARQAVAVTSEVLEAFGGAGYVEDTGLPLLLRDAQVLSIWEGTTNVLSLDALRPLTRTSGAFTVLKEEVARCLENVRDAKLADARRACREAIGHAETWLTGAIKDGQPALEAGARRFALTIGRAFALARMSQHAQWSLDNEKDARALAAARRFAHAGVDLIQNIELEDARLLMEDV